MSNSQIIKKCGKSHQDVYKRQPVHRVGLTTLNPLIHRRHELNVNILHVQELAFVSCLQQHFVSETSVQFVTHIISLG